MTGSDKYKGVGVVALLSVADSTILRYIIINKPFRSIARWWWQKNSCEDTKEPQNLRRDFEILLRYERNNDSSPSTHPFQHPLAPNASLSRQL